MKKYLAVIALIGLVVWGMYDIKGDNTTDHNATTSAGISANSDQIEQLKVGIQKGNLAPDFELKTLDGKTYKLSDLRGKKVIVNFWATWCPPCRMEMPEMEEFYLKYKDKGIEILAVNLIKAEKKYEDVPEFIDAYHITFPVLLDEKGDASQLYRVSSIPASFIVDTQGVIREKKVGPMTYDWLKKTLNSID